MAYEALSAVNDLLKLSRYCIDNNVFRLHYKATMIILLVFAIVITTKQILGEPIACLFEKEENERIDQDFVNIQCWISTTYSMTDSMNKTVGVEVVYPGVDKNTPGERRTYHKYYQWVCFALALQAAAFYLPRYIWKRLEGGRLRSLVSPLDEARKGKEVEKREKERTELIDLLVDYFKANLSHHNLYFFHFFLCEVLNFANVLGQMYLIDLFLGGDGVFSTYGLEVLHFILQPAAFQKRRLDPMLALFPRLTKCAFFYTGPSGDINKLDFLCVLPLNIFNEKIYFFLWLWFSVLVVVSGAGLIYRLLLLFSTRLRERILAAHCRRARRHISVVLDAGQIGDWFLLRLLVENMEKEDFTEFIKRLANYLLKKE